MENDSARTISRSNGHALATRHNIISPVEPPGTVVPFRQFLDGTRRGQRDIVIAVYEFIYIYI